jgi:hypothetical protein
LPSRSFPELLSRVAQHDREQDAGDADDEREGHGDEVLELHAEREQHDPERLQGVEAGNGGAKKAPAGPADHEQPKMTGPPG